MPASAGTPDYSGYTKHEIARSLTTAVSYLYVRENCNVTNVVLNIRQSFRKSAHERIEDYSVVVKSFKTNKFS